MSSKRKLPLFLLCGFLGFLGIHRFYVGKVGTGILQLFTFGGFTLWGIYDFIIILMNKFTDKEGNIINKW